MNAQATGTAVRYFTQTLRLLAALLLVAFSVPVADAAVYGLLDRLGLAGLETWPLVVQLIPTAAVGALALAVPLALFASVQYWRVTA